MNALQYSLAATVTAKASLLLTNVLPLQLARSLLNKHNILKVPASWVPVPGEIAGGLRRRVGRGTAIRTSWQQLIVQVLGERSQVLHPQTTPKGGQLLESLNGQR